MARVQKDDEAHSRRLRFIKSYLEFAIKLNQVNLAGTEQDGFGPSTRRSRLPLWSRAAEIFIYYATLKMIVGCLLQHNYSQAKEELDMLNMTAHEPNKESPWRRQKEADLERAIELVEILENPFYELGAPVEILAMIFTITMFHSYFEIRIYNHLRGPLVVGAARLFLDANLERELMVKNELMPLINTFVRSAMNYLAVSRHNAVCLEPARPASKLVETNFSSQKRLRTLKLCQIKNVECLRDMLASGELDPLNRRPEWIRTLAHIYGSLVRTHMVLGNTLGIGMLIGAPLAGRLGVELHYGWRGILYTVEGIVYCALYVQCVSFPVLLIPMSTLDVIAFATALKRMVSSLADELIANRANRADLTSGLASRRLLRVLVQYDIFKRQLRKSQHVVGFISANMISALLLVPALARVYVAKLRADIRYTFLIYCLLLVITIDMLMLPTCYLYARCLELYRAMSYLLARLDAVNHIDQVGHTPSKIHIDEHSLLLLRRELHQPEFATQQFATDAHFTRLTYANLMGVHFYFGLWLAPMFMRDTSGLGSGTSDLLNLI